MTKPEWSAPPPDYFAKNQCAQRRAGRWPYLTEAEIAVLRLLMHGYTITEAGQVLYKTRSTTKRQLETARERWGARTNIELIVRALEDGSLTWADDDQERAS